MQRLSFFAVVVTLTGCLTASATDPTVSSSNLGEVTGTVVKFEPGSITIKVPTVVQSGTTRRKVGKSYVNVPKYTTKEVESTITVAKDVTVKTIGGKEATAADVVPGESVRLHVSKLTERTVGEKPESHTEVKRIDIPNSSKKGDSPPDTKKSDGK